MAAVEKRPDPTIPLRTINFADGHIGTIKTGRFVDETPHRYFSNDVTQGIVIPPTIYDYLRPRDTGDDTSGLSRIPLSDARFSYAGETTEGMLVVARNAPIDPEAKPRFSWRAQLIVPVHGLTHLQIRQGSELYTYEGDRHSQLLLPPGSYYRIGTGELGRSASVTAASVVFPLSSAQYNALEHK